METVTGSAIEIKLDQVIELSNTLHEDLKMLIIIILFIFIIWFFFGKE
jgi:hypothetical protein